MKKANLLTLFLSFILLFFNINAQNSDQEYENRANVQISQDLITKKNLISDFEGIKKNATKEESSYILNEDFSDGEIPDNWLNLDEDGDGHKWEIFGYGDTYFAASFSKDIGTEPPEPLTPDNWLITEQLSIENDDYEVSFDRAAADEEFYAENYSVLVSTTGTDPSDFTEIYTETIDEGEILERRALPLDDYAGDNIYIAFRHHDCEDEGALLIENIAVYDSETLPTPVDEPQPANHATDVSFETNIEWTWGENTEMFVLIMRIQGDEEWNHIVDDAGDAGTRASFEFLDLLDMMDLESEYNTTYEWMVISMNEYEDEVNSPFWIFTTKEKEYETYEVTFDVEYGDGSITAEANGDDINSGDEVEEGSEVIFAADPDVGNQVADWYVDGNPIGSTDETHTIDSLEDDVNVTVGFEEPNFAYINEKTELSVFPNPANDKFKVKSDEKLQHIKLINANGQIVFNEKLNEYQTEINVNNLKQGIYFIQIKTTESVINKSVQIINLD